MTCAWEPQHYRHHLPRSSADCTASESSSCGSGSDTDDENLQGGKRRPRRGALASATVLCIAAMAGSVFGSVFVWSQCSSGRADANIHSTTDDQDAAGLSPSPAEVPGLTPSAVVCEHAPAEDVKDDSVLASLSAEVPSSQDADVALVPQQGSADQPAGAFGDEAAVDGPSSPPATPESPAIDAASPVTPTPARSEAEAEAEKPTMEAAPEPTLKVIKTASGHTLTFGPAKRRRRNTENKAQTPEETSQTRDGWFSGVKKPALRAAKGVVLAAAAGVAASYALASQSVPQGDSSHGPSSESQPQPAVNVCSADGTYNDRDFSEAVDREAGPTADPWADANSAGLYVRQQVGRAYRGLAQLNAENLGGCRVHKAMNPAVTGVADALHPVTDVVQPVVQEQVVEPLKVHLGAAVHEHIGKPVSAAAKQGADFLHAQAKGCRSGFNYMLSENDDGVEKTPASTSICKRAAQVGTLGKKLVRDGPTAVRERLSQHGFEGISREEERDADARSRVEEAERQEAARQREEQVPAAWRARAGRADDEENGEPERVEPTGEDVAEEPSKLELFGRFVDQIKELARTGAESIDSGIEYGKEVVQRELGALFDQEPEKHDQRTEEADQKEHDDRGAGKDVNEGGLSDVEGHRGSEPENIREKRPESAATRDGSPDQRKDGDAPASQPGARTDAGSPSDAKVPPEQQRLDEVRRERLERRIEVFADDERLVQKYSSDLKSLELQASNPTWTWTGEAEAHRAALRQNLTNAKESLRFQEEKLHLARDDYGAADPTELECKQNVRNKILDLSVLDLDPTSGELPESQRQAVQEYQQYYSVWLQLKRAEAKQGAALDRKDFQGALDVDREIRQIAESLPDSAEWFRTDRVASAALHDVKLRDMEAWALNVSDHGCRPTEP